MQTGLSGGKSSPRSVVWGPKDKNGKPLAHRSHLTRPIWQSSILPRVWPILSHFSYPSIRHASDRTLHTSFGIILHTKTRSNKIKYLFTTASCVPYWVTSVYCLPLNPPPQYGLKWNEYDDCAYKDQPEHFMQPYKGMQEKHNLDSLRNRGNIRQSFWPSNHNNLSCHAHSNFNNSDERLALRHGLVLEGECSQRRIWINPSVWRLWNPLE